MRAGSLQAPGPVAVARELAAHQGQELVMSNNGVSSVQGRVEKGVNAELALLGNLS
jgi:hypothetical protein